MIILLSPHDDDSILFAAFTLIRIKPLTIIVTDSYIQPARGETGCSADERALETTKAHDVLDCRIRRLGIHDDRADEGTIIARLHRFLDADVVYAPAEQGGNLHHDMVSHVARKLYGDKVIEYTTYTKTELHTTSTIEVVPTEEELRLKKKALDCYESQIRINLAHFQAVLGKSEWLSK